jgi:hypothetical protein
MSKSYCESKGKFEQYRESLLQSAKHLYSLDRKPVHQSTILAQARRLNPDLKFVDGSTLTARVRELCNPLGLLERVKPGWYKPSEE